MSNAALDDFWADLGRDGLDDVVTNDKPTLAINATGGYRESCKSCGGSGMFRSWSGRTVGQCFTCKGVGYKVFKMSPEKRAQSQKYAQKAKARKVETALNDATAWIEAHQAEYDWMVANPNFEFAVSMKDYLLKKGTLTENQLAAVRRCLAKQIAREEQKAAAKIEREKNAVSINVLPIIEAFAVAQGNGVKRPKLRLSGYKFSLAGQHSSNPGAVYVTEAKGEKTYLGKIVDGRFFRSRDCSEVTEGEIVAICADPKQAAIAYGQRTGECSVCGRELTNHSSIEAGIGPICAEKYGW